MKKEEKIVNQRWKLKDIRKIEKKYQGLELDGVICRWAYMMPPEMKKGLDLDFVLMMVVY
jgi:hypothetical protein